MRVGDAVASWNAALLETVRHTTAPSSDIPGLLIKPPPPMVAKYLAMVSGAMFDAINAVNPQYESYLTSLTPQPGASPIVAGAVAAHRVASELYDTSEAVALWDKTLAEIMATVPDGTAKTLGIQLGEQAATGHDRQASQRWLKCNVQLHPRHAAGPMAPNCSCVLASNVASVARCYSICTYQW